MKCNSYVTSTRCTGESFGKIELFIDSMLERCFASDSMHSYSCLDATVYPLAIETHRLIRFNICYPF